jgi:tRNA nucleotidyltransferase (CCA-adding enzyme)
VKLLEATDAFRRPERFGELLLACEADARGRAGLEAQPYPQAAYLLRARDAAAAVVLSEEERAGLKGPAIGEKIRERRIAAVTVEKEASCPPERPQ